MFRVKINGAEVEVDSIIEVKQLMGIRTRKVTKKRKATAAVTRKFTLVYDMPDREWKKINAGVKSQGSLGRHHKPWSKDEVEETKEVRHISEFVKLGKKYGRTPQSFLTAWYGFHNTK